MPNFVAVEVIFFSGDSSVHKSCTSKICGVSGKEELRHWGINRTEIQKDNKTCNSNSVSFNDDVYKLCEVTSMSPTIRCSNYVTIAVRELKCAHLKGG